MTRGAWIIWQESGEYSDHRYTVRAVTDSEAVARRAVEEMAKAEAEEHSRRWLAKVARPTRTGRGRSDARHGDGWWVATPPDEDGEPHAASAYDDTFGFTFVEAYTPPGDSDDAR